MTTAKARWNVPPPLLLLLMACMEGCAPLPPRAAQAALPVPDVLFAPADKHQGIEQLRMADRAERMRALAVQRGLDVAQLRMVFPRDLLIENDDIYEDHLAGNPVEGVDDAALGINPAVADVPRMIAQRLESLYKARAGTVEAVTEAVPLEVRPDTWHLMQTWGDAALYRLAWRSEVRLRDPSAGRMPRWPLMCEHESGPLSLADWQADHWRHLREERARALTECGEELDKLLAGYL